MLLPVLSPGHARIVNLLLNPTVSCKTRFTKEKTVNTHVKRHELEPAHVMVVACVVQTFSNIKNIESKFIL